MTFHFSRCLLVLSFFATPAVLLAHPTNFGKPNIYLTPNSCQSMIVTVSDSTAADQGLSDVEILWDTLGVIGPPLVSYNVAYDGPIPDQSVYTYELVTTFGIKVIDPLKPAYAAIYAVGHAADTAVYQWHYSPPKMSRSVDSLNFSVLVGANDSCTSFSFTNLGDSLLPIANVEIPADAHLNVHSDITSGALGPSKSFTVNVCFSPIDTESVEDTIYIDAGCYRIPVPISGRGLAPMIDAADEVFNGIDTGVTACGAIVVYNRGTAPLILAPQGPSAPFRIYNAMFPDTIAAGKFQYFMVCYTPQKYGRDSDLIVWLTNEPAQYPHGAKDITHLVGISSAGGLHWSDISGYYDPAGGTADTLTFQVVNTAVVPKMGDSIHVGGAFATDFVIQNPFFHKNFSAGESYLLEISFRPNLFTTASFRTATAYIFSGGTAVDSLFLTGVQPTAAVDEWATSSNIQIYPNPVQGDVLHVTLNGRDWTNASVLDELGHLLWTSQPILNGSFDIPTVGLPAGNYFLRIESKGNIATKMFSVFR